jgi:hypothetical protein
VSAGWAQIPVRKPRPCAFRDRFYLDGLGVLYGLPARACSQRQVGFSIVERNEIIEGLPLISATISMVLSGRLQVLLILGCRFTGHPPARNTATWITATVLAIAHKIGLWSLLRRNRRSGARGIILMTVY